MNGPAIASSQPLESVPTAWAPVKIGDFNRDGMADILWRNIDSGDVALWLMNGFSVLSNDFITNVATSWVTSPTSQGQLGGSNARQPSEHRQ